MSSSRGLCDVELVTPTGHTLRSLRALNCWYTQHPEYPKDLDLNNFHVETIKLLWCRCFPETCSRLAIDKDIFYIPNNFSFQEIPKYWLWAFPSNNLISLLFRCRHSIQCKFIRIFFKHWNCCDKKLTPRSYVLNNKYVMDVFWNVLIICKKMKCILSLVIN